MKVSLIATALLLTVGSSALAATRIVVLPFVGITPEPIRDRWIGPAVQQNMILSLDQARDVSTVSYPGKIEGVVDGGVASRAARATGSDLAIFGTYEVVGSQIRLTAQVVDGNSGVALSTAQVTGLATELLALEDQLSERTRTALGAPSTDSPPMTFSAEVPPPATGTPYTDALGFGTEYNEASPSFLAFSAYPFPYAGFPGGSICSRSAASHHHWGDGLSWQIVGDSGWISFGGGQHRDHHGNPWQPSRPTDAAPTPRIFPFASGPISDRQITPMRTSPASRSPTPGRISPPTPRAGTPTISAGAVLSGPRGSTRAW